jgi:2-keto-4-pentenoate hydratase/2-oxohepta-3-ene-1,7-dioic acid hydratase in catechol pathway
MRLVTFARADQESVGVLDGDRILPAADVAADLPATMATLVGEGPGVLDRLRGALAERRPAGLPVAEVRLLAPLPRPANIVAIGRNYREHAGEEGVDPPAQPAVFLKHTGSVVGPGAEVVWDPGYATQVDYEAELGVLIGRPARRVPVDAALSYVFGYTCLNDVSARDLQFGDAQWARGKSLETFCPVGPALVTPDEVPDPQALPIRCLVNGEIRQDATTADMYHSVAEIISYCSHAFTLAAGDLIATGTPGGVGYFRDPPALLGDGDEVVVEIGGIGRLVNRCRFTR